MKNSYFLQGTQQGGEHRCKKYKMIITSALGYIVTQYATLMQYIHVTKYLSDVGILLKYFRK